MYGKRMYGELVKFTTKDGLRLDGFLLRSRPRNRRAILNVFGMTGNFFSSERHRALYAAARGGDTDIFLANNRGMGVINCFNTVRKDRKCIGTARERFEDCVFDIGGAIDFLSKLGYKSVILQGHSTGCQKVAYYCSERKDRRVGGVILLAPADDYNLARGIRIKGGFASAVKVARGMVMRGKGGELTPEWISNYTAKRFLSYAEPDNAEARLFNYDSAMKEFGRVRQPILAVFGSEDESMTKPAMEHMRILESRTGSSDFKWNIVKGVDHNFKGKEKELARITLRWANRINRIINLNGRTTS